MSWDILFHDDLVAEMQEYAQALEDELLAHALLLREFGPNLGRPTVDSLKGSKHANMKELRFSWEGRSGASHLRSTPSVRPSCWSVATRPARISGDFTGA
jgi:hypothetical protein